MPAYSFKGQFIPLCLAGTKPHTIRAQGKRPKPRSGQPFYGYTGMRTKQCTLWFTSTITKVDDIVIETRWDQVYYVRVVVGAKPLGEKRLVQLVTHDGFSGIQTFGEFFHNSPNSKWAGKPDHKDSFKYFTGHLIHWRTPVIPTSTNEPRTCPTPTS